jgi:hypothetical protein
MPFRNYILNSNSFLLYKTNFSSLLLSPKIYHNKNFLSHSIDFLKTSFPIFVNGIFQDYSYIQKTFPLFILIYTDGSVSPTSAGYSFFIPDLLISFTNNLLPTQHHSIQQNALLLSNHSNSSTIQQNPNCY